MHISDSPRLSITIVKFSLLTPLDKDKKKKIIQITYYTHGGFHIFLNGYGLNEIIGLGYYRIRIVFYKVNG